MYDVCMHVCMYGGMKYLLKRRWDFKFGRKNFLKNFVSVKIIVSNLQVVTLERN